jgi:hypothetical protein
VLGIDGALKAVGGAFNSLASAPRARPEPWSGMG